MLDLIVAGGRVVLPDAVAELDIGIADGCIVALGHGLGPARETLDASGRIVLPGGVLLRVDAHVAGRALRRVLGALEGR